MKKYEVPKFSDLVIFDHKSQQILGSCYPSSPTWFSEKWESSPIESLPFKYIQPFSTKEQWLWEKEQTALSFLGSFKGDSWMPTPRNRDVDVFLSFASRHCCINFSIWRLFFMYPPRKLTCRLKIIGRSLCFLLRQSLLRGHLLVFWGVYLIFIGGTNSNQSEVVWLSISDPPEKSRPPWQRNRPTFTFKDRDMMMRYWDGKKPTGYL